MESLPVDILETIFSCLPSISTLRCKLVCKTWGSVIGKSKNKVGILVALRRKNKREVRLYYDDRLHKVKLERYDYGYPTFIICNPVTGEYAYLRRNIQLHLKWQDPVGGLGYVESTNEYKVVRMYYDPLDGKTHAHVYTLGSKVGWRIINDKIPYIFRSSGIFANGSIHFIDDSVAGWRWQYPTKIVAFDLEGERFHSLPSIPLYYDTATQPRLALLGGNLCVIFHYPGRIDIWAFNKMMRQDYDWSREYRISCECSVRYNPFVIAENNEVLLWRDDLECIYCYDPNTSTLNKSFNAYSETYGSCHKIIPHINTLVSLKDLGEPLGSDSISAHI